MPIPDFNIDGIIPPYVGGSGPGGMAQDMSPYAATAVEVASTMAFSETRKSILRGWLRHRAGLRAIGFARGFQWLDGSFVEQKEPADLDIVTFLYRPAHIHNPQEFQAIIVNNEIIFHRNRAKIEFKVDAFFVDLNGSSPEVLVGMSRYYLGLFSHRRDDHVWKGMLQVSLEDIADDAAALVALGPEPESVTATGAVS
jgi:hypothetical protein